MSKAKRFLKRVIFYRRCFFTGYNGEQLPSLIKNNKKAGRAWLKGLETRIRDSVPKYKFKD